MPTERRKKKAKAAAASARSRAKPATTAVHGHWHFTTWQWTAAGIMAFAALLRLYHLTAKPLHHDEGVNGTFMTALFRTGYYQYNPANYHGPTLYYFGWITTTANSFFYGKDGLSTFAIRLVTVLFGLGIVWLILALRRDLGPVSSLAAAALTAVSPGFVFFSRYFIHEVPFAFFSLAVVVAALRYRETRQPRYLMLASASLALLGATKETWIITVAVWLIALPCTMVHFHLRKKFIDRPADLTPRTLGDISAGAKAEQASSWIKLRLYFTAALVFAAVWVLFYSSFFTNFPKGINDSILTFRYWFRTGSSANLYSWTQYFKWLWLLELPAFIFGGVGVIFALVAARSRVAVFTAFWSIGILAAYCLIPYKTPWNALSFLLPLIIMAGAGLEWLYHSLRGWIILLLAPALAWSLYQALDLSLHSYDDTKNGYSYAHTFTDFLKLVDEIDSIAAGNPAGKKIGITVMSPEYWPLPWYLRDYSGAAYHSKVVPTTEPIIIALQTQVAEVERLDGDRYRLISSHSLRPGNTLYLYLRKDVQP